MVRVKCDLERCAHAHRLHYGNGMPVFRGDIKHVGYGIGGLLSGLARSVLPVIAPIAKNLGKSVLRTGGHILSDVLRGQETLQSSARKRIAKAIDDELDETTTTPKKRRRVRERRGGKQRAKRKTDIFD